MIESLYFFEKNCLKIVSEPREIFLYEFSHSKQTPPSSQLKRQSHMFEMSNRIGRAAEYWNVDESVYFEFICDSLEKISSPAAPFSSILSVNLLFRVFIWDVILSLYLSMTIQNSSKSFSNNTDNFPIPVFCMC